MFLLGDEGWPVEPGESGEIYIAGEGVTRGYLGQPELTRERFIPEGSFGWPHPRLYRTGDLARARPDGALIFLGRLDDQIKLRGIRIEPAEVEAVLASHPAVAQAVVLRRDYGRGDQRLVAFVVPASAADGVNATALRRFLSSRLPSQYVPSSFTTIDAIPLTPNGKLDRERLPDPPTAPRHRTSVEDIQAGLAALWQQLLQLPHPPGLDDDFFELGGHSLLAARLVGEVQERFDRSLQVSALLDRFTIGTLVDALTGPAHAVSGNVIPIRAGSPAVPLFFVLESEQDALGYRRLWESLDHEQSVWGVVLPSASSADGDRSIPELAAHCARALVEVHPQGRCRFDLSDPAGVMKSRVLTFTTALAALLLWSTGVASASQPSGIGSLIPTNPHHVLPLHGGTVDSLNWSGYAVTPSGGGVTAVSSTFTVPSAGLVPPGFAATWAGIGGYNTSDLIQAGTAEQSPPSNPLLGPQYYAWYELLPNSETQLTGCSGDANCTVTPGDHINVSISLSGTNTWLISLSDSGHWSWSKTVNYASSESSAEWILEAPTLLVAQTALAPVGTVAFGPTSTFTAGGASHTTAQGNPTQIDLSPGVVNEATPSALASDGQSFNDCAYAQSCPTP